MTAPPSPCPQRNLVKRHFAARITPAEESRMRAHLPECESCRHRYERHMLYSQLVKARLTWRDRLAIGLGVRPALARPLSSPARLALWATTAAAACAAVLVARGLLLPRQEEPSQDDFVARGASTAAKPTPQIEVYTVRPDGSARSPSGRMSARDELAFAYRNPTGFSRLIVFGVGEEERIYWFHPAWSDERKNPVAVPIRRGSGPFELREAIHHEVDGRSLRIVALFIDDALSVRAVEDWWRRGANDADLKKAARVEVRMAVDP